MAARHDLLRTLVISERVVEPSLAFTTWTEGEDLLVDLTGGDLYLLDRRGGDAAVRVRRGLGRSLRKLRRREAMLPPRRRLEPLPADAYDVAISVLNSVWNLPLLEAVPGLRRAADRTVVWFPEVWPSQLQAKISLEPFGLVDDIFVGEPRSAQLLARHLGRPVHVLPLATDVEVFAKGEALLAGPGPQRGIEVLNIGRRDPAMHEALQAWADRTDALYVYDTTRAVSATEPRIHRRMLASQLRHTNVKIASFAKHDQPETIGDVRWVPSRVFDGLASGTVLAGFPPDRAAQHELFGREVVRALPENDPEGAAAEIARLVSRPEEVALEERRRNVATAMVGHDWSHRWSQLLEECGLPVPVRLAQRAERLRRLAVDVPAVVQRPGADGPSAH